jgi:tetratricopeptide (TPR) repeat protein
MKEETAFKTTQIGIFNPGRLSDTEIERAFIIRIKLFEYLLQGIVAETPATIPQHYLVIGQRGMGKSTLLHRIAVELRKEQHRNSFIPLTFPEEQYNVDRLSKFWLNCLDALADALDREGSTDQLDQLDQDIGRWAAVAKDSTAMELYGNFATWVNRTKRRPVLLVDNLGLIFDRLSKEEQHQLRAILMDKGAPILVGASANTLTDTVDYGAPFYDAFQIQYLKKLTFKETTEVLRNLAVITDNPAFANTLQGNLARLQTLYQLTGGTPRTIVMLYPLIRGGFSLEVRTDLEGLMDVMTPLYKARFEELPEQMQVILDAVALHWDPIALDDLRQITQLENSQLSPQLKRLYEVGWIERLDAYHKKGQAYEISERFFNIWYLMRRSSRRQKKELLCLTKFLVALYGKELNQMGERVMQQNATHRDHVSMQLAIADGVKDHELARQLREKSYKELFDLSKSDDSVLKDFDIPGEVLSGREGELFKSVQESFSSKAWSEALASCEEILRLNPQSAAAYFVKGDLYQDHLGQYDKAEEAYRRAIERNASYAYPWNGLGNLYKCRLGQYDKAEEAYCRAIELDKTFIAPWNGLGNLYQDHLEKFEEAEIVYRYVIDLEKKNIYPKLNLIFLYRDKMDRLNEAKVLFEELSEPNEAADSYWLNASLFALYDKNQGIAEKHLLHALQTTEGELPPHTQDDWWRFAAVALRLGYGQAVLDILQKNGYEIQLRPYYVAIQSLIEKEGTAYLNSIAAEVREVATDVAGRIKRFM